LPQTSSHGFNPTAFVTFSLSEYREREASASFQGGAKKFKLHHRWSHLPVPDFQHQLVWLLTWQRTTAKHGSCPPPDDTDQEGEREERKGHAFGVKEIEEGK
jgi:hypothetical protein